MTPTQFIADVVRAGPSLGPRGFALMLALPEVPLVCEVAADCPAEFVTVEIATL